MNYIVAVSGGVDSIVLLDMMVAGICPGLNVKPENLIVAHFDHGIRPDSLTDEKFVRGVAGEYGLAYESERAELGQRASEDQARQMRYKFLRRCCNKYNAELITAHHQDDLIETMVINLIRGTGWRGLVSLDSNEICRPLLSYSKSQLIDYAKKQNLMWREDSTNLDEKYLRNYVRLKLIPQMIKNDTDAVNKLLAIYKNTVSLKKVIATELQKYIFKFQISNIKYQVPRYQLVMLPTLVALEVIYDLLTRLDPAWHPTSLQLKRVLHFAKTAAPGKRLEVSKHLNVVAEQEAIQFIKV